jgi:hypothetical protein
MIPEKRAASCTSAIGSPFQKRLLSPLIPSSTCSGFVIFGLLEALGKSTLTECVSNGAVIMKITNKTNITSTNGTTLISAIGA